MRTYKVVQFGCLFLVLRFPGLPTARAQLCDLGWTFDAMVEGGLPTGYRSRARAATMCGDFAMT